MRHIVGAVLALLAAPVSARADIAPRGTLAIGATAGGHDHLGDAGGTVGVDFDADVRVGMFTLGGQIGRDDYAVFEGVPVHARTLAGRVGVAVPLVVPRPQPRLSRTVRVEAIGSLETGVHDYSPVGERQEFLGPTVTYRGDEASRTFVGARLGVALDVRPAGADYGLFFKVEVVGRRDLGETHLDYSSTSCGGLFEDSSDCSDSSGTATLGGTELGVTTSIGIAFGG